MYTNFYKEPIGNVGTFKELAGSIPCLEPYNKELEERNKKERDRRLANMVNVSDIKVDPYSAGDLFNGRLKTHFEYGIEHRPFKVISTGGNGEIITLTKEQLIEKGYKILGLNTNKVKEKNPEVWDEALSRIPSFNMTYSELKEYIEFYHFGICYNVDSKQLYLLINSKVNPEDYPTQITNLIENKYSEVMILN